MHAPGGLTPSNPRRGGGRGPFGERGFRVGLVVCALALVAGTAMVSLGADPVAAVDLVLLVIGGLGLVTAGLGLLGM